MKNKLFALLIVGTLIISLVFLYMYNKQEIKKQKDNELYNCELLEEIDIEKNNENIEKKEEKEEKKYSISDEKLGKIKIEKIKLEGEIKEGSSNEVLKEYVGHIEETANFEGNVGLAAHNRGNIYSYFARINELENGDEIIYESIYGIKKYKVTLKKEILETDWSLLEPTKENKITLITCIKNKVNKRLCVQATEISS